MRKVLYGISVVCALLMILYGLNFFTNEIVNSKMRDNVFDRNEFAWLGFMEPWKEPYNLGTNFLKQRRYDEAITEFDKALAYNVPADNDCEIRINKALALSLPVDEYEVTDLTLDDAITKLEMAQDCLTEKGYAAEDGSGEYEDAQILYDDIENYIDHLLEVISTKFYLSKVDKDDLFELRGASIVITGVDKDGKEVKFEPADLELGEGAYVDYEYDGEGILIVTGNTPTLVDGIHDGTYVLHEQQAPKGYDVSKDIKFEVKHCRIKEAENITAATDVTPATITMTDELFRTDIKINKIDAQTRKPLMDAELTLTGVDVNGKEVVIDRSQVELDEDAYFDETYLQNGTQFYTGKGPTTVRGLVDGTYTLHEDKAPTGYGTAPDITFTIENGVVKGNEQDIIPANGEDIAEVTMRDSQQQDGGGDSDQQQQGGGGQDQDQQQGGGQDQNQDQQQGGGQGQDQQEQGGQGQDQQQSGGQGQDQQQQGGGQEGQDDQQGGQGQDGQDQGGGQEGQDDQQGGGQEGQDEQQNGGQGQDQQQQGGGVDQDKLKHDLQDLQDQANQQRAGDLGGDEEGGYREYDGDKW